MDGTCDYMMQQLHNIWKAPLVRTHEQQYACSGKDGIEQWKLLLSRCQREVAKALGLRRQAYVGEGGGGGSWARVQWGQVKLKTIIRNEA